MRHVPIWLVCAGAGAILGYPDPLRSGAVACVLWIFYIRAWMHAKNEGSS